MNEKKKQYTPVSVVVEITPNVKYSKISIVLLTCSS